MSKTDDIEHALRLLNEAFAKGRISEAEYERQDARLRARQAEIRAWREGQGRGAPTGLAWRLFRAARVSGARQGRNAAWGRPRPGAGASRLSPPADPPRPSRPTPSPPRARLWRHAAAGDRQDVHGRAGGCSHASSPGSTCTTAPAARATPRSPTRRAARGAGSRRRSGSRARAGSSACTIAPGPGARTTPTSSASSPPTGSPGSRPAPSGSRRPESRREGHRGKQGSHLT